MLEIKNLVIKYDTVEVIHSVSLCVEADRLVSLIGANGAGKTTILRTISALNKPTSGEISYDGQRIDKMRPEHIIRKGIAHVPEGRRIFPRMTVFENLEIGGLASRGHGDRKEAFDKVFEYFPRLRERKTQRAGSLSGGEQQMLAIGRALMAMPSLILMDEPSLGLAPLVVQNIAKIIKNMSRIGKSILLVEQNAFMALQLADRSYVLETGRIVLEGESKNLMQDERVRAAYFGG